MSLLLMKVMVLLLVVGLCVSVKLSYIPMGLIIKLLLLLPTCWQRAPAS
jgi:hypothetical protein